MKIEQIHKTAAEIKHSLCESMSNMGIRPSELEAALLMANIDGWEKMSKTGAISDIASAISLPASALTTAGSIKSHILSLMGMGLAVGAAGGVGTAMIRHKLDNIDENSEDEEMRKDNMRMSAYKKMIEELKTDMASE